jgi:hypothetical protein
MINIGTLVKLNVPCLGNSIDTLGICYENYNIGYDQGVSIIFENGNYDGFSEQEQKDFLTIIKHTNFQYNFTNVIQLNKDFDNGIFDILKRKGF